MDNTSKSNVLSVKTSQLKKSVEIKKKLNIKSHKGLKSPKIKIV